MVAAQVFVNRRCQECKSSPADVSLDSISHVEQFVLSIMPMSLVPHGSNQCSGLLIAMGGLAELLAFPVVERRCVYPCWLL